MSAHPPDPCFVHRLPQSPTFVGRDAEMARLRALWRDRFTGVLALVGLGGAGKTVLAARFLDELHKPDSPRPCRGTFVWSFYQEPDPGRFLLEAYHYFAPENAAPARGAGLLHLLQEALSAPGPHLLVLDGLERVQQTDRDGVLGRLDDPLLKALLRRISEMQAEIAVLVTSRFPLTDLESQRGRGYLPIDLNDLDEAAAATLLHSLGVQKDDKKVGALLERFGSHPLTLQHLGGVIGQFLGGDPDRLSESDLVLDGPDRQAARLAKIFRAYEDLLPEPELALLSRLCLLRRSIPYQQVEELFLCTPTVRVREIRELALRIGRTPTVFDSPEILDLRSALVATGERCLCESNIAGPESLVLRELWDGIVCILEKKSVEYSDIEDLVVTYPTAVFGSPETDQRPLSSVDREMVQLLYETYRKHRESAFSSDSPNPLQSRLMARRTQNRLHYLVAKHGILKHLRELMNVHRQKWKMAGCLATLDAERFRAVFQSLVARRLVLEEEQEHFSVHPAVRDYFSKSRDVQNTEGWHGLLRNQLLSLTRQPGKQFVEDPASLDFAEEAVYHALHAGKREDAMGIYRNVLGGLRHLAWKLGEMARGLRILRQFETCPDRWALGWFLRALGEFDEAHQHNDFPHFRSDIRLIQGRLPLVAAEGESARTMMAEFLMGKHTSIPHSQMGYAMPRAEFFLRLGQIDRAERSASTHDLYQEIGYEGDRANCLLVLAEVARLRGRHDQCETHMAEASRWILHSGSIEHLCRWHLQKARQQPDSGEAQRDLDEALLLARTFNMSLHAVDILCRRAELAICEKNPEAAETHAREALRMASNAECQYLWGAGEAGHILGHSLLLQGKRADAIVMLERVRSLRQGIGDPKVAMTHGLRGLAE